MTAPELTPNPTNLPSLQERLLTKARGTNARRAAETLYGGRDAILRQTAMALLSGAELPEHESPPEATLQLLTGRVRLRGLNREWLLETGDLIPIPPERHSVTAVEDSVLLLTVRRAAAAQAG
ncbi:cupin domain-containing protein [Microbacterium murale]|uniref:LuxR family transcriptional regulator n=1 Tax=Microbacterium murale TaxID=1081040 RepID=A0ABQ1RYN4_9MICO|nr:cupin domain-containing protein [Microbacterium murale]GGD84666.1 LuxR family transcriptional regulator [Microbacterium murale]